MRIRSHIFTILDMYHKGYERGTLDLELTCKVGGSVDVVAIELRFGSNVFSIEQEDYLDKLNTINVTTFLLINTKILFFACTLQANK